MADIERQLREHYRRQMLPDEQARSILAAGRAVAEARRRRRRGWLAIAAAVVIGLGVWSVVTVRDGTTRGSAERIAAQNVAAAVVGLFAQPDYQLSQVSADSTALLRWLRENGGPDLFAIPPPMAGLSSYGCQVLDVRGRKVFLICFFLDSAAPGPAGATPMRQMTVTAPDGTMMKKDRPLVHLVVAPRSAFRDAPEPGSRVRFAGAAGWSFEAWQQDELVYLIAGAVPAETLAELGRVL